MHVSVPVDAEGKYEITAAIAGDYKLSAKAEGVIPEKVSITLNE